MPDSYETVLYDVAAAIATVTINNPAKRNALAWNTLSELRDAVGRAKADRDVRAVILTGAGEQAFSAGADLSGIAAGASALDLHESRGHLVGLIRELWDLGKPTIAKVRGFCLAGGFGVALSCDILVAATDAIFGTPEINVGIWPMMITVPLIRSMPPKKALELMMTGRRVGAEEGERLGFVTRVVPPDALDAVVAELAAELAGKSPVAMRLGRDAFYDVLDLDAGSALAMLQAGLAIVTNTEDAAEGIRAFQEKRPPEWSGR
jgi:enoyl-CoA hydratase/carnithine racemase